jgi:hypothetical protein
MLGKRRTVVSATSLVVAWIVAIPVLAWPALAQYVNNQCGSPQGICSVNPAPVGSPCSCFTNLGPVPGQILSPGGGFMPQQTQAISNACRTFRGVCQTYPAPVGSVCGCFGDPGTVVQR